MEQPTPDTKNWTWVLERPCTECGFDGSTLEPTQVAAQVRTNAAAWRAILGRGAILAKRPPVPAGESPVWSALEYGAHVRDVYALAIERTNLMLDKKNPTFVDWDQDKTAVEENYPEEDPNQVSYDLAVNAGKFADILDKVNGDSWERTGMRSDGAPFTVGSFAVYLLHDPVHHIADVERGFEAIKDAS